MAGIGIPIDAPIPITIAPKTATAPSPKIIVKQPPLFSFELFELEVLVCELLTLLFVVL